MPKTKISEFSATPANNTDIDSINIAEGCAPSGINDAIRELMAQLKDWQAGTSNDPMVIGSSGSLTLNQGTANSVAYLNGSKVVTTGSGLQFDGSQLGIGGTPNAWGGSYKTLQIITTGRSLAATTSGGGDFTLTYNATYDSTDSRWEYAATGDKAGRYSQTGSGNHIWYVTDTIGTINNPITFNQAMTLDSVGNLGLGVTPSAWNSGYKALQFSNSGALFGATGDVYLGNNVYSNSSDVNTYITTNSASMYRQTSGQHLWYSAASGTAGANITFTRPMTLDASNNLLLGRTSLIGSERLSVEANQSSFFIRTRNTASSSPSGMTISYTAAAPNNAGNEFIYCEDNSALRMTVRANGGISNFSANNVNLSDRREKTNFAPAGSYLNKICAIPVQTFNYIDQNMEDDSGLTLGVVAQDVQAVAPEMVMESNWGTEESPKMRLSIYQTDLQYALMKCIQEQQALIETLTQRITALEAK